MKNNLIVLLIASLCTCIIGCKKFLEVPPPVTQITDGYVFENDRTATASVNGLYSQVMSTNRSFLNGGISLFAALSADEIVPMAPNQSNEPLYTNSLQANDFYVWGNIWVPAYNHIYHINAALSGLETTDNVSTNTKMQLTGELRFMRALCYLYLVNFFGEVPLVISTDYNENAKLPGTNVEKLYVQIENDLLKAKELLTVAYTTAGRVRPNKMAAESLLARVYLYLKDWQKAEKASTSVIETNMYSINSNLNTVFAANSTETIWQLMPVLTTINTSEGNTYIPASANIIPAYTLHENLLNAFTPADKRKTAWVNSNTIGGTAYHYPAKYKVRTGAAPYAEHNIVLRLAEQYLIRAEARGQLNNIEGAKKDVNVLRTRAGLTMLETNDKEVLLNSIFNERRLELFTEWGHRWFDLKRTNKIDSVLSLNKTNWKPYASLYPIPLMELEKNPFLNQNPGY